MTGEEFDPFQVPDEIELVTFFGAEPIARVPSDGYWCYQVEDADGVTLRFSMNVLEASVQTQLLRPPGLVETVSFEGARRLFVDTGQLRCELGGRGWQGTLVIEMKVRISVRWSLLLVVE